jgi:hypothetical protein
LRLRWGDRNERQLCVEMRLSRDAAKLPRDQDAWPKPAESVTGRVTNYRDHNQEIDLEWLPIGAASEDWVDARHCGVTRIVP